MSPARGRRVGFYRALPPGMGMTALAVEAGGEGTGPPAVEVVEPEGGNSGSDETVGTPLLPRAGDKNAAHNKSFR